MNCAVLSEFFEQVQIARLDEHLSMRHYVLESIGDENGHCARRNFVGLGEFRHEVSVPGGSSWSCSATKRIFDCTCVLIALPLLIPVYAGIALSVRLTSRGPVLFRQKRMGAMGQSFTILKFRTMLHREERVYRAIATASDYNFTSIGRFLRRWKLDELPQLLNVLLGQMSLVGPRPKMIEHSVAMLRCRPGITGAATIVFAREEVALSKVPKDCLEELYHTVILPTKQRLDEEYMSGASFVSDMKLLLNTVLRRWDADHLDHLIGEVTQSRECETPNAGAGQEPLELAIP